MGKDVFYNLCCTWERNCTQTDIDVDVETPMKPHKYFRSTIRLERSRPLHSTAAGRLLLPGTKLKQTAMGRRIAEVVYLKNFDPHAVPRATFSTELGVFDDPYPSQLPPGYSVGPDFVNDVPYDWILNCCLTLGLSNKALEQL